MNRTVKFFYIFSCGIQFRGLLNFCRLLYLWFSILHRYAIPNQINICYKTDSDLANVLILWKFMSTHSSYTAVNSLGFPSCALYIVPLWASIISIQLCLQGSRFDLATTLHPRCASLGRIHLGSWVQPCWSSIFIFLSLVTSVIMQQQSVHSSKPASNVWSDPDLVSRWCHHPLLYPSSCVTPHSPSHPICVRSARDPFWWTMDKSPPPLPL